MIANYLTEKIVVNEQFFRLIFRCRNLLCCCACGNCSKGEEGAIQSEAELLPTSVVESAKVP